MKFAFPKERPVIPTGGPTVPGRAEAEGPSCSWLPFVKAGGSIGRSLNSRYAAPSG
jgi:hypothetical protein